MSRWLECDEEYLVLNAKKFGFDAIAKDLGRSRRACVDKYWRLTRGAEGFQDDQVKEYVDYEELGKYWIGDKEEEALSPFQEAVRRLNYLIGFDNEQLNSPYTYYKVKEEREGYKIAIMPCLHIPLHSEHNLAELVSTPAMADVNELVVAGDMLDCLSAAHAGFKRNIRVGQYTSLVDEMATGKVVLQLLSSLYPKVTIMRGNHLDRIRKYFTERVPEFMFLVNFDILRILAADFKNVTVVDEWDHYGNDIGWIYQVGDVRICHAEVGSKISLKAVTDLDRWMGEWKDYIDTSTSFEPYRMLVECHTHQAGILYMNGGNKILVEGGCMCKPQQYSLEPSIPYPHPQTNAVTLAILYDGKVDVNSVQQIVFDKTY